MGGRVPVRVAVCTYRRPDRLAGLLPHLLEQVDDATSAGDPGTAVDVDVVVVDNDPHRSARPVVEALGDERVAYEHEPRRGISAARNRALDSAEGRRLLVFVDDDELPRPGWLAHLLRTWAATRPAAVAGHVVARFAQPLDPWIAAGEFFVRGTWPTGTERPAAATNNLLLDLDRLRAHGLRFDPAFGLTGGEDTMLTSRLTAAGERIVWCAEAVVDDVVTPARSTRRWVLDRAASHGRAGTRVAVALAPTPARRAVVRARRLAHGSALASLGAAQWAAGRVSGDLRRQAWGARRLWRGRGVAAGVRGDARPAYARNELVVLQSFPTPRPTTNPYVIQLRDALEALDGVRVETFSWRTALLGRYAVFHAHWPEILVEGRTPARAAARQALFAALLVRLRLTGRPLVRTRHNLDLPSGLTPVQTALLRLGERWTTLYIRLTPRTPVPAGTPAVTVRHGHYRDWFAGLPREQTRPGRLGYVGQVRRYKGVERLVDAFAALPGDDLSLHVAGRPTSPELAAEIRERAAGDPRVVLRLEHLDDADLVTEVTAAELVVLPYRHMHNSGGALAALSLDRPVLVPDNEVNRDLQAECGPGWVHVYAGELDGPALARTLAGLRDRPPVEPRPRLTAREWPQAATDHLEAYRQALAARSRRRLRWRLRWRGGAGMSAAAS